MFRFYGYKGCGTCQKASKWLDEHSLEYENLAIRETPPTEKEFRLAIDSVDSLRRLFNTSGVDYRAQSLKDVLPSLSEGEAIELLMGNGNLVKRPFLVYGGGVLIGFKEDEWMEKLLA